MGKVCGRIVGRAMAAIAAAMLVAGCDVSNLAFVQDDRVRIVEPRDRSAVTLPVTLRWQVNGFVVTGRSGEAVPNAGYFAVFVDRPPIPPGRSLEWYARQEDSCGSGACGTVDNLHNVYTTGKTTLRLRQVLAVPASGDLERHEVVIVLMDGTGHRIGESAFDVEFNLERKA